MVKKASSYKFYAYGILTGFLYFSLLFVHRLKFALGDNYIVLLDNNVFSLVIIILFLLLLMYIKTFRLINNVPIKHIVVFAVVFNFILLFVWPIASTDIFSYIYQSRVVSIHQANPYLVAYDSFTNDAFYDFIRNRWSSLPAIYGPAFFFIAVPFSYLAQNNIFLNMALFKVTFVILNIVNILLVHKITKSKRATFLYAWSPYFIFEFVGNTHHDVVIIFFLLLGISFLVKKPSLINHLASWILVIISGLIKFYSLIFLPVFYFYIVTRLKNWKDIVKFTILSGLIFVLITVFFYFPFWESKQIFARVSNVFDLFIPFASPLILFYYALLNHSEVENFLAISRNLGRISFIIFYIPTMVYLVLKGKLRNSKELVFSILLMSTALFTSAFNWLMPWYATLLATILILHLGLQKNFRWKKYLYLINILSILPYLFLR